MIYLKNKRNTKVVLKSLGIELNPKEVVSIPKRKFYSNFIAFKQDNNATKVKIVRKSAYRAYLKQNNIATNNTTNKTENSTDIKEIDDNKNTKTEIEESDAKTRPSKANNKTKEQNQDKQKQSGGKK